MFRTSFLLRLAALLLAAAAIVIFLPRWNPAPRLTEQELRDRIFVALQEEADTSFVVTGYVDLSLRVTSRDTRTVLPGVLNLSLGTSEAAVQVPGRVSYGFDLASLRPEMISLRVDTVELEVPQLAVYSAEPRLEDMQVQTERGWARLPISTLEAERRAISHLSAALRRQGDAHLRDSSQPRVNTAETLRALVAPILFSAGIEAPYFRIFVGESLVMEDAAR